MGNQTPSTIVIGAGPAGLAAAYYLSRSGAPVRVYEQNPESVGGIARTIEYKGFRLDIGGHRFYTKSSEVDKFWSDVMADDFLVCERSSSILYNGQFYRYPLRLDEAFHKLGLLEAVRCTASFLIESLRRKSQPRSFEDWVRGRFGLRLYEIFFKPYTEKVWGMPCSSLSADWAAQRINQLTLGKAILNALSLRAAQPGDLAVMKTLISQFRYPRLGPGMLWERVAQHTQQMGGIVNLGTKVIGLANDEQTGHWRVTVRDRSGQMIDEVAEHVVSSAPLGKLFTMLNPAPQPDALAAAGRLRYRDFILVGLVLKDRGLISDQWVYVHDPNVRVGRIQNFKRWSPHMVPDGDQVCYGLEYFCSTDAELWRSSDLEMIEVAKRELATLLPITVDEINDAFIVRQEKAYPVYDMSYKHDVSRIRRELETRYSNLHVIGRNGMHKYNNQDHSILTGFLCAQNILGDSKKFDVWKVNQDAEYIESEQLVETTPPPADAKLVPS